MDLAVFLEINLIIVYYNNMLLCVQQMFYFPCFRILIINLNTLYFKEYENVRIRTAVDCLSKTGFNLTIESWKPTLTYDAWVQWMACPK